MVRTDSRDQKLEAFVPNVGLKGASNLSSGDNVKISAEPQKESTATM